MTRTVERPVLETEPIVISEQLTRKCAELSGTDAASIEEKRKTILFKEIEWLSFSFRNIAMISNLQGLSKLQKLQLDNNAIHKIQNLEHLTNLTWLDLSFNSISKIEGLESLTKLQDLSLFSNNISTLENLDTLVDLQVLSVGNNNLKKLNNVMYLRQFRELRLLKLSGNPISQDQEYKSYVISHISQLMYLDYRRIPPSEIAASLEHHQDEMMEILEKEEHQLAEEQAAKEHSEHAALMLEANLTGIECLLEDMIKEDGEWGRLIQIPGLLDGWNDIKDKFNVVTEEFKGTILEQLQKKKAEFAEWQSVIAKFLKDKDSAAKEYIVEYEKLKKRTLLGIAQEEPINVDALLVAPRAKLIQLKQRLLDVEQEVVEIVGDLCQEFEANYSEIIEANKGHYNTYYAQVRDLENTFASQITSLALQLIDRYASESHEGGKISEEARTLLGDKDMLMNSLQVSHDSHTTKIDASEDQLLSLETKNCKNLLANNALWKTKRNRNRVAEIVHYIERNMMDLDEAGAEDDNADHYR